MAAATALKSYLSPQRLRELMRRGYNVQDLPRWTSKLIYSSYFENLAPTLSYRGSVEDRIAVKREKLQDTVHGSRLTNIPVSLQFVAPELLGKSSNHKENEEFETKDTPLPVQFPYRQVRDIFSESHDDERLKQHQRPILQSETTEEETGDWFHDYGTPDSSIPATDVPCGGCGAFLHCQDTAIPGYTPSERIKMMNTRELRKELCQRCYFFSYHNTALKVNVSAEDYPKILNQIKDKPALVILLVDLLDFPCSLWPGMIDIIGTKRPVILVGNKVDLLPRDSTNYLQHLRQCLESTAREAGLETAKIVHTALISARTGFGVESLITKIFNAWGFKGDIYLMGCTNVGKSSLFNAFLQSDLCKVQVIDLIQRATISAWPGTTLNLLKFPVTRPEPWRLALRTKRIIAERVSLAAAQAERDNKLHETRNPVYATLVGHIGRSFENPAKVEESEKVEKVRDIFHVNPYSKVANPILPAKGDWDPDDKDFANGKWCFDTPGAVAENQILDQLTLKELMLALPKEILSPKTYLLYPQTSLFIAGLARVDFKETSGERQSPIRLLVFTSHHLPINVVETEDVDEVYREGLGSPIFGIPFGDAERLGQFPPLQGKLFTLTGSANYISAADIVISSTGWIGLNIRRDQTVTLEVFTPGGKGLFCRVPSFLPNVRTLRGKKLRGSLSYSPQRPFLGSHKLGVSQNERIQAYDDWARTYDEDLRPGKYNAPEIAAQVLVELFDATQRQNIRILDVAAGTGRVGHKLNKLGFKFIDALDPSSGMLKILEDRNIYLTKYKAFIGGGQTLDVIIPNLYDVLVTAGGMGEGHIPTNAIYEMIRLVKSGGTIVIVMREEYLRHVKEYVDTLEPLMEKLEQKGYWKKLSRTIVPDYAFNLTGVIFIYRVTSNDSPL